MLQEERADAVVEAIRLSSSRVGISRTDVPGR
jgi:hypothetical protein